MNKKALLLLVIIIVALLPTSLTQEAYDAKAYDLGELLYMYYKSGGIGGLPLLVSYNYTASIYGAIAECASPSVASVASGISELAGRVSVNSSPGVYDELGRMLSSYISVVASQIVNDNMVFSNCNNYTLIFQSLILADYYNPIRTGLIYNSAKPENFNNTMQNIFKTIKYKLIKTIQEKINLQKIQANTLAETAIKELQNQPTKTSPGALAPILLSLLGGAKPTSKDLNWLANKMGYNYAILIAMLSNANSSILCGEPTLQASFSRYYMIPYPMGRTWYSIQCLMTQNNIGLRAWRTVAITVLNNINTLMLMRFATLNITIDSVNFTIPVSTAYHTLLYQQINFSKLNPSPIPDQYYYVLSKKTYSMLVNLPYTIKGESDPLITILLRDLYQISHNFTSRTTYLAVASDLGSLTAVLVDESLAVNQAPGWNSLYMLVLITQSLYPLAPISPVNLVRLVEKTGVPVDEELESLVFQGEFNEAISRAAYLLDTATNASVRTAAASILLALESALEYDVSANMTSIVLRYENITGASSAPTSIWDAYEILKNISDNGTRLWLGIGYASIILARDPTGYNPLRAETYTSILASLTNAYNRRAPQPVIEWAFIPIPATPPPPSTWRKPSSQTQTQNLAKHILSMNTTELQDLARQLATLNNMNTSQLSQMIENLITIKKLTPKGVPLSPEEQVLALKIAQTLQQPEYRNTLEQLADNGDIHGPALKALQTLLKVSSGESIEPTKAPSNPLDAANLIQNLVEKGKINEAQELLKSMPSSESKLVMEILKQKSPQVLDKLAGKESGLSGLSGSSVRVPRFSHVPRISLNPPKINIDINRSTLSTIAPILLIPLIGLVSLILWNNRPEKQAARKAEEIMYKLRNTWIQRDTGVRQQIINTYNDLLNILAKLYRRKKIYETHREYDSRLPEELKRIHHEPAMVYEKAKFSTKPLEEEDLERMLTALRYVLELAGEGEGKEEGGGKK